MIRIALLFALTILISQASLAGPSDISATHGGLLTFTVRTATNNGTYAPKHVLAIWVEKNGTFVKSRKVMGNARKQYLYSWVAASSQNSTDAVTGATLTTHQTHTVSWDFRDLSGNLVPDGEYTLWVEFTEKHAQGPKKSFNFTKGPLPLHLTPADESYFKDMVLDYTPVTADFSVNAAAACPGENLSFSDNSTNATSWAWNFGEGASPATASGQGPHSVSYSTPGTKTVSLTINGNLTENRPNAVDIHPVPAAGFSFTANGLQLDFTGNATGITGWAWDFGDGTSSTDQNPSHLFAADGTYTVSLIVTNGNCTASFSQLIEVSATGIPQAENGQALEIIPIPGEAAFHLRFGRNHEKNLDLLVYSVSGKTLLRKSFDHAGGPFSTRIDLKGRKGVVFVEINADGERFLRKLMIP